MPLPDYIDNSRHKLEAVLKELILSDRQTDLDIATGFFRIEAWIRLEQAFNALTNLRLLVGRDPAILPAERSTIDLIRYFRRSVQGQLEEEPLNLAYKRQIDFWASLTLSRLDNEIPNNRTPRSSSSIASNSSNA